ncbi:hypothetical protein O9K51_09146 [Purpureocillium lavendulum]|uniref:Telomeric single stranded DNA binding POT1/Cdc13 domain-containing protein n=1 Tax=Purpureocillium lavendulum TaxID=1247861 RepID=A0AB34FGG4_9HYPO|nr:hypothetical protein O9K51_09146 [Purpureocillium lavendulum]
MGRTESAVEALQGATATPIAQLSPDIQDSDSLAVSGVVTITWPYSVVTKSIAFILAEHDPLRRRDKGQLRVECRGPAGKALADSRIGGGDDIRLSLVGVEWDVAHAKAGLPAGSHDWQLKFNRRLLLRARKTDSQETIEIDLDAPETEEPQLQPNDEPARELTPPPPEGGHHDLLATPSARPATLPAKRLASAALEPEEFASPAFLKRARVSYGSLFDDGYDVFAENRANKPKTKRKSRFSMGQTVWRYSSRSPSPEPEAEPEPEPESETEEHEVPPNGPAEALPAEPEPRQTDSQAAPPLRPSMVDEGSQTQDLYFSPSMHVQVLAESRPVQGTTTLVHPEARHDDAHVAPYTPSRTLFGHGQIQSQDISRSIPEPLMDFHAPDPHHHDFGMDMGMHHHGTISDGLFGERSSGNPPRSTTAFGEGVSAQSYPVPGYGVEHYAPIHDIDPNLHVQDDNTPVQPQHGAVHQDDLTWQNDSMSAHFHTQPVPHTAQYGTVALGSSSPTGEPARTEEELAVDDAIPDAQQSVSRGQSQSREQSIAEVATSDDSSQEDAAPEYQDGGDLPGEDYDLRNYDHAKADDQSESDSEEESLPDQNDPDKAAIDFSEEDEEDEEEEEADEEEDEDEEYYDGNAETAAPESGTYGRHIVGATESGDEADEDLEGGSDSDARHGEYEGDEYEGEYYDEEEDEEEEESYYDEDEEVRQPPPVSAAPAEPVFISLLSDSEGEDEAPPKPAAPVTPPKPAVEPEERAVKESSLALAGDHATSVKEEDTGEAEAQNEESDQDVTESVQGRGEGDRLAPRLPQQSESSESKEDESQAKDAHPGNSQPQAILRSQGEVSVGETAVPAAPEVADTAREALPTDVMEVDETVETTEEIQAPVEPEVEQTHSPGGKHAGEETAAAQKHLINDEDPAEAPQLEHGDLATSAPDEVMHDVSHDKPTETQTQTELGTEEVSQSTAGERAEKPKPMSPEDEAQDIIDKVPTEQTKIVEKETVQLPTPITTQHKEEQQPIQEPEPEPGPEPESEPQSELQPEPQTAHEDDEAAAAQIMNEYYSSQSPKRERHSSNGPQDGGQANDDDEPLITVRSLRSHSHRKTLSADTTSETHDDPSVRLATAQSRLSQPPTQDVLLPPLPIVSQVADKPNEQTVEEAEAEASPQSREQKELKSLAGKRTARNKSEQPTTQDADDAGKDKKPPPHLTLRASRSKNTRADPSLQLSKHAADDDAGAAENGSVAAGTRPARSVPPTKTSPSSRSTRRHDTPETTRELRSRSHGEARGVTPETATEVALKSPSVAESVAETEDVAALKKELLKMLRTGLPDALPLRSLRTSLNKTVDIMAVSTTAPPQPHRPKHGPRDYMLELIVTDPTAAPSGVSVAHVFRPHVESLPVVQAGDVVLLRRMQVVSVKGRGFGVRVGDASAWAVFEKGDEEMLPQIKGPPVEVTDGEVEYARGLRRWWATLDDKALAKIGRATQKASQS